MTPPNDTVGTPVTTEESRNRADKAAALIRLLDLETIETDLFRGHHEQGRGGFRLFGGQVLAQALAAAARTVDDDRQCHSLHAYFLRAGTSERPAIYQVERVRSGRSFTTRRIVAIQNGEAIFNMDASFQIDEVGLEHQTAMPEVPPPDALEDDGERARRLMAEGKASADDQFRVWIMRSRPFETRAANQLDSWQDRTINPLWLRFCGPVPDDQALQRQLLAYASDMGLVSTSMLPHQHRINRDQLQMASLDHAMWFYRPIDVTRWLLYVKSTDLAFGARGFNQGMFFAQDGTLLASTMQEGLMRVHKPKAAATAT